MASPSTNIPLSLDLSCRRLEWLHDRSLIHVPIGQAAFNLARDSMGTSMAELTGMMLYQHGVQPVVLTTPPLMKLLIRGCGCERCNKCAASDAQFDKGWVTAHQLLCFYAAVLQTNAVSTAKKSMQSAVQTKPIDKALGATHRWMLESLKTQRDQGPDSEIGRVWARIWTVLGDDGASDADRVAALRPLATEYARQPGYTLAIIHQMEHVVWALIMRRSPAFKEGEKDKAAAERAMLAVHPMVVECPPTSVQPMTQWQHDTAICAEVKAWTDLQGRAIRRLMCGGEMASQLTQWPSIRLPTAGALAVSGAPQIAGADAPSDVDEIFVSLESSMYTVFSMVYGELFATRKPEVVAPAAPVVKQLPAIEEMPSARQD